MSANRKPWTLEEDQILISLVSEFGVSKWGQISRALLSEFIQRSGKQCRERWHNHLDPEINKNSWTETEKSFIFHLHKIYSNHWSKISKYLPGRSDNAVKNFFYSTLRKNLRRDKTKGKKNEQIQKVKSIKRKKVKKSEETESISEASAILISLSKSKIRVKNSENLDLMNKETVCPDFKPNNFRTEPIQIPMVFAPKPLMNSNQFNEYPVLFFN